MKTAMMISPHADDAAAFCGGKLAKFAREGWSVILVRVTDDRKDSVGLTMDETIARNTKELLRFLSDENERFRRELDHQWRVAASLHGVITKLRGKR